MVNTKGNFQLKAKAITFSDGSQQFNKKVFRSGDFLLVEGENGEAPTMYNMRFIRALQEVEEIRPESSTSQVSFMRL